MTVALWALLLASAPAAAVDTVLIEGGTTGGRDEVDRYGGAVRWSLADRRWPMGAWSLGVYLEAAITRWNGQPGRTGYDSLTDAGLTPVLRWVRAPATSALSPYLELGLGIHLHSESGIGNRNFDIPFAFGSHIGGGLRFGSGAQFEIGYRFQHLSNASLGDTNPGIEFHIVQLGYHW